ncbi:MAG: helix-hairpin-helix domain-containing protein [Ignavibacteria bacterium]|nr:helix-hairpin-helix domain-containing protein [Ignavibacteria bacterium]
MWKRLTEWLAFTQAERKVILFLVAVLVAGMGIRLYQSTFRQDPSFDYTRSDSTFAALSEAIATEDEPASEAEEEIVNLNTATKEELMGLTGVGSVLAERILEHRAKIGKFRSIEEIQAVRGISKKKFEQIRNSITIDNSK